MLTPEIRKIMTENISKFASLTLRTICIAYKDIPVPDDSKYSPIHSLIVNPINIIN